MDTVLVIGAVVGGICTVLAAVGSLIVSLRTNDKIKEDIKDKDEKLEHIRVLVNSQLTEAVERLKDSQKAMVGLERKVAELSERLADETGNPQDIEVAEQAQAKVDVNDTAREKDEGSKP